MSYRKRSISEMVENVNPGKYDICCNELDEIFFIVQRNVFQGVVIAFKYGFLKGQRAAAKAENQERGVAV